MDVKKVNELPVLDQSTFPTLPELPEDTVLLAFSTAWQNAEKEFAAGIITTVCIRAKAWKPVSAKEFIDILTGNAIFRFSLQEIVNAMWWFAENCLAEVVQVGEMQYIVPKPEMAQILLARPEMLRAG